MLGKTNVKVKPNKSTILEFVSSIAPTVWNAVTEYTEYTAINEYGTWRIWAGSYMGPNSGIYRAFDNDNTTTWQSAALPQDKTISSIGIDPPEGVFICPKNIYIRSKYLGNSEYSSKLLGLNKDTSEWEELYVLDRHRLETETNIELITDSFYSKFKLEMYRYSGAYQYNGVYEFQITSGLVKIGGGV